jgi:hypothetical protein
MTGQAPGKLWMYFLEAVVITVPASLVILAGYRRSVARSMRQTGDGATMPLPAIQAEPQAGAPAFVAQAPKIVGDGPLKTIRLRLALVYGMGSVVAAAIMAFLFAFSMRFDLNALAAFVSWYVSAWPLVPITIILLALPQGRNITFLLIYVLLGALIVIGWSGFSSVVLGHSDVSPLINARFFLEFLVRESWLPYLIILVTGNRRLRPVSPIALAGLLIFSFGSLFARDLYIAAVQADPKASWFLFGGASTYSLWYFVAAVPIGYVCWLGIQWLASWYERKRFSDVQLLVDSWWLIVAFQFSSQLASDFGWGGLAGLLAFAGYRGTVEMGLRLFRSGADRKGPTLLLLRVFGFQRRTETLFDSIAEQWRFLGPVTMIAGTDLAMRTVSPGDIVGFMSGRLQSFFIGGEARIHRLSVAIDGVRDPDGRFRTIKFFCRDDTWRAALIELLRHSDLVLMDLRGFTANNSGCVFEIHTLVSRRLLPRTLLVVDDSTDVALLEATVRQYAVAPDETAPRQQDMPPMHVSHLTTQSAAELARVYERLNALAGS